MNAPRARGLRPVRPYVHGTDRSYEYGGCRCDECRAAHAGRVAQNRAERLATGRLSHGTRSVWDAGCRCLPCHRAAKAARNEYLSRTSAKARSG